MIRKQRLFQIMPVLLIIGMLFLSGCQASGSKGTDEITAGFFAMDTYMNIRAYHDDPESLSVAEEEAKRLEKLLSVTDSDSEIYKLDHEQAPELSAETRELIQTALEFCEKSEGCFDISVYPLVQAWGFTTGEYKVPAPEEIAEKLQAVDYRDVRLNDTGVTLGSGMQIDLGGITKGYLGDRLRALFEEQGIVSAILDLGGNIVTLGTKPDGSLWKVGVRNPLGEEYLGYLELTDCSIVTSGGYERYFTDEDGQIWWHILDPFTGYPAKNGLISVTVIGENGAYCDAMSTALFVMGTDKAIEFWKENQDFEAVFVTEDNRILLTKGIADIFTFNEKNADQYTVETID